MLYWLIPLVFLAISMVGIVFLVFRKLPALAALPELAPTGTQDQKKKEQIIKVRFQRVWAEQVNKIFSFWRPVSLKIKQWFFVFYKKFQDIEARYQKQKAVPSEELKDRVQKLVWEAGELVNQADLVEAEKKYIQVITWDRKNVAAYKGLADLYWRKKDYQLAQETLEHVLKINRDDPEIFWQLGSIILEKGNQAEAFEKFYQAFQLTPNNPKYLDSLLEICIILGRKDTAWQLASRLKEVNPDNQKLKEFEDRIRKL